MWFRNTFSISLQMKPSCKPHSVQDRECSAFLSLTDQRVQDRSGAFCDRERKCECPDGTSSISSPCALSKPGLADFCETTFKFCRQDENKLDGKYFECGSEQKGSVHKLNCKWFSGSCRGRRV